MVLVSGPSRSYWTCEGALLEGFYGKDSLVLVRVARTEFLYALCSKGGRGHIVEG